MKKNNFIFWISIIISFVLIGLIILSGPLIDFRFNSVNGSSEKEYDRQTDLIITDEEITEKSLIEKPVNDYFWYDWKLPIINGDLKKGITPSFFLAAQISAWLLYFIQQFLTWFLIWKLFRAKPTGKLNKWNMSLLATSLLFGIIHIAQTVLFYEGLAQKMPIFTSQGSVIIMLVFFLLLLNWKRGLIFGRKIPFPVSVREMAIKVHPYIISWAIIYTFWYHPTETTIGHLMGFFYTFLLLIQMSFARTKIHSNKYWIIFLELFVLFHSVTVAMFSNTSGWTLFAYGFGLIFIVTQLYGLKRKRAFNITFSVLFLLLILITYSGLIPRTAKPIAIGEIFYIAIIEYALVFLFAFIMLMISTLKGKNKINESN